MDDIEPTLGVGFAIDTGASFEDLTKLDGLIDEATANAVAEFAKVERASGKMLDLAGATASMTSFGNAATKQAQATARELAKVEKSGEAMVRQLERQNAAFGKSRSELRAMKADAAALAAEQNGLTELAQRIRDAEAELYAQEFAAMRQARAEAEAAAEAKEAAAAAAAAAAEAEAKAVRDAANAYRLFEAVAKQRMAEYRQQQADDAAAQMRAEAAAAKQLGAEHARLATLVRESHDAQVADAEAAERLRMSTDPLYAAVKRLNAEIAESTRLYHAGATAPEEYARQQVVLAQRLKATTEQHEAMAVAGRKNAFAMQMVALQAPDIVQGLLSGQKPMAVFIQQGGQIAQIGMMAEGGLKGFAVQLGRLTLALWPFTLAAGAGWGAIKLFQSQVKDSGELTRYRNSLGLTHKEMLKLSDGVDTAGGKIKELADVTVTTGDVVAGLWQTIRDTATPPGGDWSGFQDGAVSAFQKVLDTWNAVSAGITAGVYGTANAAKVIWNNFATSVGDAFYQSANFAIDAMNTLAKAGTDLLNGFIHGANKIPGVNIGDLSAPQLSRVANPYPGAAGQDAATAAAKAISDGYRKAYADAKQADADFWKQVGANAKQHAKDRMAAEAAAIKANRTPKTDRHAEQLAREAAATEAQITNLYALADAYGASGAAALIAEAREKAESKAIKQRADIEAAVGRQIRLAVAQRVADAAKSTAAMNDQASVQEAVNAQVTAGLVPASRASQLIQDQIALLPLLAAQQVAQQIGNKQAITETTKAIDEMTAAQKRQRAAEEALHFNSDMAAGADQLAQLREELQLVGATDAVRVHQLAILKATQEAQDKFQDPVRQQQYIVRQVAIADQQAALTAAQRDYNDALTFTAEQWDLIARNVQVAGQGMEDAFGGAGRALGDLASAYATYHAQQEHEKVAHEANLKLATDQAAIDRENAKHALATATSQIGLYGDLAQSAKGFFKEGTSGYKAMADAEKAFRAIQFALSVKAIAQDAIETGEKLATSAARTAANAVEAVTKAISSLPFPANLVAGAATIAALAAIGVTVAGSFGGGHNTLPAANDGTGTVLGDATAKSDSIKNAIDALKEVDTLTNTYAREMSASLKSIDSQIGGLATVLVRAGDINASAGVDTSFKPNLIGSVLGAIPLVGGFLGSLFGSKKTVIGSGIYGAPQSLGSILAGGFDADAYSDIKKKHKFFGITTSTSYNTKYGALDPTLESQFTLILKSFHDAIEAAAGPLGVATSDIESRVNSFVVNIGKIDLKGLTGQQIQDKLEAVFGAAADKMADAAFPGIEKFQQVGEGAFETLVRVASTVEQVTNALDELGDSTANLGIDAKMGLAAQFDSISDMTSAVDAYFQAFYSTEDQTAAKTAELQRVFDSLGLTMPTTLDAFRQLVDAQDLTSAAGQETYATLIKLAPAFADLQEALNGAKSAADIASEHDDLQKQLLELQGDTAALRAMQLAALDPSNRALQEQIWAIQDAQDAAKAAQDLADAWTSVGDSIMDEVKRIRGLNGASSGGTFASLMGQFNAATAAARGGDQDAAKSLPQLSQDLLNAANLAATSRQELDRIQAQIAASLEATYAAIMAAQGSTVGASSSSLTSSPAVVSADTLSAAAAAQPAPSAANDDMVEEMKALRAELAQLRDDSVKGHAAVAANTGAIKRKLDDVTAASGGAAVSTVAA